MTATLGPDFEAKLQEAVLDDAEQRLLAKANDAVEVAHEHLRRWGQEADYDVDPIIDSLQEPTLERDGDAITVRWGWEHPAAPYFEFGTSDHTIEGDPVLSFVWSGEDAPRWVKKEFDREGDGYRVFLAEVEVSGVKETRFGRHAIHWLRRELS